MDTNIHFNCTPEEIKQIFIQGLREFDAEKERNSSLDVTFSIN